MEERSTLLDSQTLDKGTIIDKLQNDIRELDRHNQKLESDLGAVQKRFPEKQTGNDLASTGMY